MAAKGPEIRIGLVLYGGVSLAVYIYGVVVEVQRLLRAAAGETAGGRRPKSAYTRALAAAGASRVTVDIVAGTSAGGINGILLAKALARGSDLKAVRHIWEEEGDIERLLQPRGVAKPRALLDSGHFERQLRAGLEDLGEASPGAPPPPPVLDLFVSATHLAGGQRRLVDSLDNGIDTRRHRYVFQLKLRGEQKGPLGVQGYDEDDFGDDEWLVTLARATSAFPVAFEPVKIAGHDDVLGADDEAFGWFADGGILNNKPFSEAVETIFSRSSDRPVRRWLFSIDPDPVPAGKGADPDRPPSFDQIALRSVTAIPRYQSIVRDLVQLEVHNERVVAAEQVVRDLEAEIAATPPIVRDLMGLVGLGPGSAAAYRRLRRQAWEVEAARISGRPLDELRGEPDEEVEVPPWDLVFARRRVYYLIKLLTMAEAVEGDRDGVREALWAEFEEISAGLWRLLAGPDRDAGPDVSLGAFAELATASEDRLREALGGVAVILAERPTDGAEDVGTFAVPLLEVFDDFPRRDAMLLSADVYGGLRQRDRVNHAQISPLVAGNTGVDPESKLAGDALGHFGGFLDKEWRRNDLLWGRLDAAEILTRAVLADYEGDDRAQLVDAAQEDVLRDEELDDVLAADDWKEELGRRAEEGPAAGGLDGSRMVGLGLRASGVLRRMLGTAADDAESGGTLDKLRARALHAVAAGIGFLLLIFSLPARAAARLARVLR